MAEEVQVTPTPKPVEPAAPEIPEERLRAYAREKYGIDDDPETWKTKRQKEQDDLATLPRYQEALQYFSQRAVQAQAPRPQEPDEATLRDQARLDPWAGITYREKKLREEYDARFNTLQQHVVLRDYEAQAERFNTKLAEDWPEAHDKTTELHKEGARIYQAMSPEEKARPDAPWRATAIAAGLIGLPPRARRGSAEVSRGGVADEAASQGVERGSKRPSTGDAAPMTRRQRKMVEAMGIDTKVFATARKARAEGKDMRVG